MLINKRTIAFLFVALFVSTMANTAQAQFKVATVDVNRILNESKEAVAKRKELDAKSADARKKLEEKGKALKQIEEKLKAGSISEDSKEAQQYRAQAREFTRQVKDAEDDLKNEFMKTNKILADKALKLVSDYAKASDIDLVLDKSEKGRGPVLYGSQSFDITDAIIQKMNQ